VSLTRTHTLTLTLTKARTGKVKESMRVCGSMKREDFMSIQNLCTWLGLGLGLGLGSGLGSGLGLGLGLTSLCSSSQSMILNSPSPGASLPDSRMPVQGEPQR
jgi:hypothetical protein